MSLKLIEFFDSMIRANIETKKPNVCRRKHGNLESKKAVNYTGKPWYRHSTTGVTVPYLFIYYYRIFHAALHLYSFKVIIFLLTRGLVRAASAVL